MWQVVNHTGESHPLRVAFTLEAGSYGDSRVEEFQTE